MQLMNGLRPLGFGGGFGAGIGGLLGFGLGGPTGIIEGAKTGFMLGTQTGIAFKADKALDATGKKIMKGLDNAGRKVEIIADKAGAAIEKAGDVLTEAVVKVMDVWSKIYLAGTAIKLGMNTMNSSIDLSNTYCTTAFESFNCCLISMTTLSGATAVTIVSIAVALKTAEILREKR